jgi:ubiquinone/menaquinone biosynthesis C-methylase UbiE
VDKREFYQRGSVASEYDRVRTHSEAGRFTQRLEVDAVRRVFAPSETLLEVACGTGRILKSLRADGRNVMGLDQSESMLKAGGLLGQPGIVTGDVFQMPFPDGSIEGLYTFRFTNHYGDLSGFFRECGRVLKPGGGFLFDIMRWSPLVFDFPALGGRNYLHRQRQLQKWLGDAGFSVESVEGLFSLTPYFMARLPKVLARCAQWAFPKRWYAVTLWHARKVR